MKGIEFRKESAKRSMLYIGGRHELFRPFLESKPFSSDWYAAILLLTSKKRDKTAYQKYKEP